MQSNPASESGIVSVAGSQLPSSSWRQYISNLFKLKLSPSPEAPSPPAAPAAAVVAPAEVVVAVVVVVVEAVVVVVVKLAGSNPRKRRTRAVAQPNNGNTFVGMAPSASGFDERYFK